MTDAERDEILLLLQRSLASKQIVTRPDFSSTIEHVIDALWESGYAAEVTHVERQLGDIVERNPGIVMSMMHHYGELWFGEVHPSQAVTDKLAHYVSIGARNKDPRARALARVTRLLRAFRASERKVTDVTRDLIAQIATVARAEQRAFLMLLDLSAKSPTLGSLTTRFLEAHKAEFALLDAQADLSDERAEPDEPADARIVPGGKPIRRGGGL